ncbi:histidine kinase [Paenibacillus sacheonensis]|uniref:HAMP domain-containing protein n=1 Tax=Paenibacillus sacheonensis TaxID=742054 RepID=A0A7X4YM23_9BACL|nr:histidine kinase [Paenibacillus sacheonensis]MBM7565833.1 two-component system sensor histidine kinase YesM [Paenibacillus sacheonensis]NBC68848.1 HAMP domain-containing protein [Paenibacillus sacheonensis]
MIKTPMFSIRNTLFLRLIFTFLLILMPLIILGVYLYQWSIHTAREDIAKTAASQTAFYLTDLENEIERIKLLQFGLLEDEDLNKLTLLWNRMGVIEKTDKINSLRNRLYLVQNSSKYIKKVSVYINPIGRVVSSVDGVSPLEEALYEDVLSVYGSRNTRIIEWRNGLYLSAAKPSGRPKGQPLFIVEIELDQQKLTEALAQFNTYSGSGTLLLTANGGIRLASGSVVSFLKEASLYVEQKKTPDNSGEARTFGGHLYYTIHAGSGKLDMAIYRFIPSEVIRKPLDKFYAWAWLFAAAAFVIVAIYAMSTYKFIHKPLLRLVKSFRRVENGDLEQVITHASKDEFGYLYSRFNQMVANLRSLIDQAYRQKLMAQRSELKQLQSQINPHFLFNSLFILSTMARTGDMERVEQFTIQLGEYFRFVTRSASDEISLEQEIHHARTYMDIQLLRFSRRIRARFEELPEEAAHAKVPRLVVQPIIENAFEHSLERIERNGLIVVRFESRDDEFRIVVEDNGNNLSEEKLGELSRALANRDEYAETTGMVNIHRRLTITFGERGGVRVARSELGGLQVTIHFPWEGQADVPFADRR